MDLGKNINILKYNNFVAAGVIVVVFIFIIRGLLANYSRQQEELKRRAQKIMEKKGVVVRLSKAGTSYETAIKDFFRKDPSLFKITLEKEARKTGLSITSFKTSRKDTDLFWEVTLRLKADSSYSNFVDFLKLIEQKSVEVEKIKMSRDNRQVRIDEIVLKGLIFKE